MLNKNGTETERNHEVHTDNSDVGFPNYEFYYREDNWSDRSNIDSIRHKDIF